MESSICVCGRINKFSQNSIASLDKFNIAPPLPHIFHYLIIFEHYKPPPTPLRLLTASTIYRNMHCAKINFHFSRIFIRFYRYTKIYVHMSLTVNVFNKFTYIYIETLRIYDIQVWKLMVLKYVDALNIVKRNIEHECNNDSKIDWWN